MHRIPPNAATLRHLPDGRPARGRKPGSVLSGLLHPGLLTCLLAIHPVHAGPPAQNSLPAGAQVDPSQVTVTTSGSKMTITQSVQRAIVNWESYNIGADAWVDYRQPNASSITLNRVLSSDPSQIFGRLTANGQVWLINPAGVLFGRGSSVNVGGLVASTLAIADDDFMNGRHLFMRDGALGSIVNQGEIIANGEGGGGLIALLAPEVRNEGLLVANLGTVTLAAGDRIALDSGSDGRLKLSIDPASVDALVENRHLIRAEGGQVILSARAASKLSGTVVQNGGAIEANSLTHRDGIIRLEANRIAADGKLDVSAKEDTARGGSITLIADKIATEDILDRSRVLPLPRRPGLAPAFHCSPSMPANSTAYINKMDICHVNNGRYFLLCALITAPTPSVLFNNIYISHINHLNDRLIDHHDDTNPLT